MLPTRHLIRGPRCESVALGGRPVRWRDYCLGNDTPQPQGQLSAPHLLRALTPKAPRRGRKSGGDDTYCTLGIILTDLFSADDDVFTGGLADPTSRVGVLSFHRYLHLDAEGKPVSGGSAGAVPVSLDMALQRACKTAAHEVAHLFGLGHCLHRACLMNGAGHLLEDFAAPPYLCPVDLAKLIASGGASSDVVPRYDALLRFCDGGGAAFAEQAAWIRSALAFLGAMSGDSVTSDGSPSSEGAAATDADGARGSVESATSGGRPPRSTGSGQKRRARGNAKDPEDGVGEEDVEVVPLAKRLAARQRAEQARQK